jgi:hypothetical protein
MKINKFMFAWLAAWLSGLLSTFGRGASALPGVSAHTGNYS